eukprot:723779_1
MITTFFEEIFSRPTDVTLLMFTIVAIIASWVIFVALLRPYDEQKNHIKMLKKELFQLRIKMDHTYFEHGISDEDLRKASEISIERTNSFVSEINGLKAKEIKQIRAMIHALEGMIEICKENHASPEVLGSRLSGDSLKLFQGYLLTIFV